MTKPSQNIPDNLQYVTPNTVVLNLTFILTLHKELTLGMPYLLLEGNRSTAVKLLNVRDAQGFVYLIVQNLQTQKTFELSWDLNYTGSYWLWSLADYDTLMIVTPKDNSI
jgi:hypothetical protein